jgi:hypothetical protein
VSCAFLFLGTKSSGHKHGLVDRDAWRGFGRRDMDVCQQMSQTTCFAWCLKCAYFALFFFFFNSTYNFTTQEPWHIIWLTLVGGYITYKWPKIMDWTERKLEAKREAFLEEIAFRELHKGDLTLPKKPDCLQ